MTSATRPSWAPAKGGYGLRDNNHVQIRQYSSRDLASHMKLKLRQPGQNAPDDLAAVDLKSKLEAAEHEYLEKKNRKRRDVADDISEAEAKRLKLMENPDADDSDDEDEDDRQRSKGKGKAKAMDSDEDNSDGTDDDEDDDDDETEALLRELEKIKREKAEEKEREERERLEREAAAREEAAMSGNPLMNALTAAKGKDFAVKKRWDEDVIFKNQARKEKKAEKRFINDLLRSDFHRKFMSKYIK
ncbi:Pre-mRNA-splicing factor Cwf15/Cwc15 [Cladochytrium replicatum]|nr:Pre-mRNA-splicing factor Cwf15/Cwc15 [Cladochytrium replicatum]